MKISSRHTDFVVDKKYIQKQENKIPILFILAYEFFKKMFKSLIVCFRYI